MSNEMKVIMERWDRFILLENESLDKIKKSESDTKNLIQQVSQVKDKEQLQNFLNIVSQDEEIMDLISSFKKMKELAKSEKVDEGLVDDFMDKTLKMQADVYVKASNFFDTELGKKIIKYGPATAAIAMLAYGVYDSGGIELDTIKDAAEIMAKVKAKKLGAMDLLDYVGDVDAQGVAEEQI